MKLAHCLIGTLLLGMILPAAAAEGPTAEQWGVILNLSGRQRTLTQKMSKETLLVAAGIDADANRESLKKTMELFETTLAGLRDGNAEMNLPPTENKRIVKQLDTVKELYAELRPIFAGTAGGETPSKDVLTALAEKNLPLLANMNKAVKMYERESKSTLTGNEAMAIVINLAGRQRMLTQKMSKEYLLVYLGINADENRLNVRETSSLFDRTLNGLIDGDADLELPGTKEPEIRTQLETVKKLWKGFQPIVSKAADDGAKLTESEAQTLASANLPLLKEMNSAVLMYEKLSQGG